MRSPAKRHSWGRRRPTTPRAFLTRPLVSKVNKLLRVSARAACGGSGTGEERAPAALSQTLNLFVVTVFVLPPSFHKRLGISRHFAGVGAGDDGPRWNLPPTHPFVVCAPAYLTVSCGDPETVRGQGAETDACHRTHPQPEDP